MDWGGNELRVFGRTPSVSNVLSRVLVGAAAVAATVGAAGMGSAWADPTPEPGPPPPPNVNAFTPVTPADFTVNDGVYAFAGPGGVTCVMSRATGSYGCSGPLPGAPDGANVVTGGPAGAPGFSVADRPIYRFDKPREGDRTEHPAELGHVSCGVDGAGAVICVQQLRPDRLRPQPGGHVHRSGDQPAAGPARGHQPVLQLTVTAQKPEPCTSWPGFSAARPR